MPVQGTDISLSVPIRYPDQPVESLVLQWRTSADVYVLQVKLFKDFQVAHVHPLDDESGKCVHDMSKQNHAFIIKGIISFKTPECAWFIYESSVPLPEFIQKTSMARTTHSHKQQITENLILGFLERLREIHNMGLFHGRLRERGSLLIAERAIPKFGNFQGHSKTVIQTRCDDEVEDLKAIKEVLKDALMPMKDILNSQVFGFVDSFIVNEFITSSKHLQSVHHHPTFLSEERLMEYIILTHERIQHIQAKHPIDLSEIDVEIMKFESCQSWTNSVPDDYIDVLYFNREKWVEDTKPAYLNTPRGFLHFARNIGVHRKDKTWAEHGTMIVDTWPEMLSAFHQVMTCFDLETKLVK
ncbi:unnamed protein product [Cuscuta campestris]|uniref:Uncharacterized protein n=1 Tax=Cuscuta campestris TaxID=132261 RepID=A0A484L9G5_9ASTE|nr:unnamed protein product [Cuscuta campestris]